MTPDATFDKQPGGLPEELEFKGQSYLYPFEDEEPRSCGNQLVPFEYCICQFERYAFPSQFYARTRAGSLYGWERAFISIDYSAGVSSQTFKLRVVHHSE